MDQEQDFAWNRVEQDYSWAREACFEVIAWTRARTLAGPGLCLEQDQDHAWTKTRTKPGPGVDQGGPEHGLCLDQA